MHECREAQLQDETAATALCGADVAVMRVGDGSHDGQPEAGATGPPIDYRGSRSGRPERARQRDVRVGLAADSNGQHRCLASFQSATDSLYSYLRWDTSALAAWTEHLSRFVRDTAPADDDDSADA